MVSDPVLTPEASIDQVPLCILEMRTDPARTVVSVDASALWAAALPAPPFAWADLIDGKDRAGVIAKARRAAQDGAGYVLDYHVCFHGAPPRRVREHGLAVGDRARAVVVDLEAESQGEDPSVLASLVRLSPALVAEVDTSGTIVAANPGAEALLGYSQDELVGSDFRQFLAGGHARIEELFERGLLGLTQWTEVDVTRKDGGVARLSIISIPRRRGGRVEGSIALGIERARTTSRLPRAGAEDISLLIEGMTDGFVAIDRDWRFAYVNTQAERFLRRPREELLGRVCWEAFDGLADTEFGRHFRMAAERGQASEFESFYEPLGAWYMARVLPTQHGIIIYFRETTRTHQALRQLRSTQEQLIRLVGSVRAGVLETDAAGHIVFANGAACALLGVDEHETLQRGYDDPRWALRGPDGRLLSATEMPVGRVLATGEPVSLAEASVERPDGTRRSFVVDAAPRRGPKGELLGVVATITDITEQRELEAQVERAQERYRSLIDQSPQPILVFSPEGRLVRENTASDALWPAGREHSVGLNILQDGLMVMDAQSMEALRRVFYGEALSAPAIQLAVGDGPIRRAFEGVAYRLDDPDGLLREVVIVWTDVTDRLDAAARERSVLEQLEARVHERTAALGRANRELEAFSYSVSHDLRAPARAVLTLTTILEEERGAMMDERTRGLLDRIRREALRMGRLIDDLLGLAKVGATQLAPARIDVAEAALAVVEPLRAEEPQRDVELVLPEGGSIVIDRGLLMRILENLLGNAWKYTRDAQQARVEVGLERGPDEVVLWVRDNGIGFDPERTNDLFKPFRRLPNAAGFEGTGIGLATVARAAQRMGGRAWAEARVGEGATFYVALPQPRA